MDEEEEVDEVVLEYLFQQYLKRYLLKGETLDKKTEKRIRRKIKNE